MNKLLILGGSEIQIPAILEARRKGYYVITCSYNAGDPGHAYSHEFHNVNIAEREKVLTLAQDLGIDLVLAYASDVAVPVAAYINEKFGAPGNSLRTIEILTQKDRFRQFLRNNGFSTPKFHLISKGVVNPDTLAQLNYPVVVKPVDSSGCRGSQLVKTKSDLVEAIKYAFSFSRKDRVLIEDYIYKEGPEVTGDGFVTDGELVFLHLGDHHYDPANNELLAFATTWPSVLPEQKINEIKEKVGEILGKVGYRNGPVNVDARIGADGNVYILEIAPRNGGNFIPQLIKKATGFDSVDANLKLMAGKDVKVHTERSNHMAMYLLHSPKAGILSGVKFSSCIQDFIIDKKMFIEKGSKVDLFKDLSKVIGVLFLEFKSHNEMNEWIPKIKNHFEIEVLNEPGQKKSFSSMGTLYI